MEVAMKKLHYGWFVCAACTLVLFCTIGFTSTAFSVYIPYINEFGGLTKTQGGPIPGVIADISGSYAPAYALLTTLIFASVILIQYTYWQTRRNNSKLLTDMDV